MITNVNYTAKNDVNGNILAYDNNQLDNMYEELNIPIWFKQQLNSSISNNSSKWSATKIVNLYDSFKIVEGW